MRIHSALSMTGAGRVVALTVAAVAALTACGDGPGEPCTASGDGFSRTDSCERSIQCVTWEVACEGGRQVVPDVCSGRACGTDDDCGEGGGCAMINMTDSECLPQSVCPEGFAAGDPVDLESSWATSAP